MKKKLLAATLMAAMTMTTVAGSSTVLAADDSASTKVITDSMGNEVEVPTEIKSMAILPMPWISVVYALNGSGDIITGMQQVAKNSYETSILKKLAPELEDTNTTFFADGEFNYEELAKINPDVVMLFESQSKHIDKLKEVGNLLLAAFNYTFNQCNFKSLHLIITRYCNTYCIANSIAI